MSKENFYFFMIGAMPFIIFAGIEFLPWWLSTPMALLGTMFWIGCCHLIGAKNEKD